MWHQLHHSPPTSNKTLRPVRRASATAAAMSFSPLREGSYFGSETYCPASRKMTVTMAGSVMHALQWSWCSHCTTEFVTRRDPQPDPQPVSGPCPCERE